jgi:hypothetical protein
MLTVYVPALHSRLRETLPAGTAIVGSTCSTRELIRVYYGERHYSVPVTETFGGRVLLAAALYGFDPQGERPGAIVEVNQLTPIGIWNADKMRVEIQNTDDLARWLGVANVSARELEFETLHGQQPTATSSTQADRIIQEFETLSHNPEEWGTLDDSKLIAFALYNIDHYRGDTARIPIVKAVYRLYVARIPYQERRANLSAMIDRINAGKALLYSLLPSVTEETAWDLVSTAVLEMAQRMPLENDDPSTGVRFFRKLVEDNLDLQDEQRAAILTGLLLLGDRRALPILRGSWRLLGQEGRAQLAHSTSGYLYASMIDFFLDWLAESDERDFGKVAAALTRMPFTAAHRAVIDVERPFPIGKDSPPPKVLREWSFQEYGRVIEPRLRDIMRRESAPKLVPWILEAWDIERVRERKLSLEEIDSFARAGDQNPDASDSAALSTGSHDSGRVSIPMTEDRSNLPTVAELEQRQGDAGLRALDYVFQTLGIEREWSVRESRGFTWWPHRLAQRVWADARRTDDTSGLVCLHVETDVLRDVPDNAATRTRLLAFNGFASLSAWVWRSETRRVALHSTVYATPEEDDWLLPLFAATVALQAADAHIKASVVAEVLGGSIAAGVHPTSGLRSQSHGILDVLETLFVPAGKNPSPFTLTDFEAALQLDPRPRVLRTTDGGLAAEYPFYDHHNPALVGRDGALLIVSTTEPHPQLGSGLLMRLQLPIVAPPASDNQIDVGTQLNEAETHEFTRASLLGGWCLAPRDTRLTFVTFIPAALHRRGLLDVLARSTAARVRWAKQYLQQQDLLAEAHRGYVATAPTVASPETSRSSQKRSAIPRWWLMAIIALLGIVALAVLWH